MRSGAKPKAGVPQDDIVFKMLRKGEKVSRNMLWGQGIFRLSAIIYRLRLSGMRIFGNPTEDDDYVYFLDKKNPYQTWYNRRG